MATYNFTDGSIPGQMVPPDITLSENETYIKRNIVDCSKQTLDAGNGDVGQALNIPAGTTVLNSWLRVITAETANGNVSLGYGSDPDRWGHGLAIDATGVVSPVLTASATWDPASIATGDQESKDITVSGAKLGDIAVASLGVDVVDLVVSAEVTAANTVTVTLANVTGAAVNLASTTVTVWVNTAPLGQIPLYFSTADTIDVVATTDVADVDIDGAKFEVCALCVKTLDVY